VAKLSSGSSLAQWQMAPKVSVVPNLTNSQVWLRVAHVIDGEPFRAHEAKRRIRSILNNGLVDFEVPHFREEAAKDDIEMTDVVNVLRAGIVEEPEYENGSGATAFELRSFASSCNSRRRMSCSSSQPGGLRREVSSVWFNRA